MRKLVSQKQCKYVAFYWDWLFIYTDLKCVQTILTKRTTMQACVKNHLKINRIFTIYSKWQQAVWIFRSKGFWFEPMLLCLDQMAVGFSELDFVKVCRELDHPEVDGWELLVQSHGYTVYRLYDQVSQLICCVSLVSTLKEAC